MCNTRHVNSTLDIPMYLLLCHDAWAHPLGYTYGSLYLNINQNSSVSIDSYNTHMLLVIDNTEFCPAYHRERRGKKKVRTKGPTDLHRKDTKSSLSRYKKLVHKMMTHF